jgi:hypothetical protein
MEFEIKNRFSGGVQFTAEIECKEDTPLSLKIGLAVKWGIENGADLSRADLSEADLSRANLSGANLSAADLSEANLSAADLSEANLYGANLYGANLYGADLSGANLSGADLYEANLSGADLSGADLSRADLSGADNAPVIIHWLPWTTFVYKDKAVIGCQKIMRDDVKCPKGFGEYEKYLIVIKTIWVTVFPIETGNEQGESS